MKSNNYNNRLWPIFDQQVSEQGVSRGFPSRVRVVAPTAMTRDFSSSFYFFLSSLVSVAFAKENWLTMERREKKGDNDGDHLFYFVVILFLPIKICWKFSLGVERRKRLTRQKKWKKIPLNKNVPGIELRTFLNDVIALMLEQTPSPDSFVSLFYVSFVDVPCH